MQSMSARLLALSVCLFAGRPAAAEPVLFQRENVLGTSFELRVQAAPQVAGAALDATLAEIQRLDAVLSTWREDSELSRFNVSVGPQDVSQDLRAVLQLCEQWRVRTDGAFSCRLGSVAAQWRLASSSGTLPDRAALRALASSLEQLDFEVTAKGPLTRPSDIQFNVDGLAKGYVLDRAMEAARTAAPAAEAIKLDIGGDGVYWQASNQGVPWQVGVADPDAPRDNGTPLATLSLQRQAIASSGHASRGYDVGRRHFSHILHAASGWPVQFAPSATVVAADATTADALATALSIMPIREGQALVDGMPEVAALIQSDTGIAFSSRRWPALLADQASTADTAPTLMLDYEIPQLQTERYRAPYLAVWIAHADGRPVRQLLVLGDRSRYLSELPLWWRHYGRDDLPVIQGVARPTRLPGHYSLTWDGRDDLGRAMPAGNYVLSLEAAREHGGHELLTLPFALVQGQALDIKQRGQSEIGALHFYKPEAP